MKRYFKRYVEKHSKTIGERNEVDELMSLTFIIQSTFGHHVLDPKWNWRKYIIYYLLNVALMIYVFFGTMYMIKNSNDFKIISEAYFTFLLTFPPPIRVCIFANNRVIFRKLYLTTKTTFSNFIKSDSEDKFKRILRTGTKVKYSTFCFMFVPIMHMTLKTLWNYVKGTRIFLSRSTSTLLPMTSPYYEIALLLHITYLVEVGGTVAASDMCYVFLIYFLCVTYDSLIKMLHVEPKSLEESYGSYEERLNDNLKNFYLAHLELVKYERRLNQMFKWLALVPLGNSSLCLCVGLLVLSKEINWHFGTAIVPLFFEIMVYCWFGEHLKTKANDLNMALLNYDWTSMKLKDRKNYYILTIFMNKESGLRTAIGIDLSLITMTSVLKFSYQAFTVLKTME